MMKVVQFWRHFFACKLFTAFNEENIEKKNVDLKVE